jgi:hypothetical protein
MSTDVLREVTIDDDKKQKALEIFSDNYTRIIISTMIEKPKSALQITSETKIPITTVYRKLHQLLENNLQNFRANC